MDIGEGFETVQFCQIATPEARGIRLEDRPAVYAWYRRLTGLSEAPSEKDFLDCFWRFFESKLSPLIPGRLGYLYEVMLQETPGTLAERSKLLLKKIAASPIARDQLSQVLELASPLQAPLYVGKAVSLRKRIGEHVAGGSKSELKALLSEAKIRLDQCLLRFHYVDGLKELVDVAEGVQPGNGGDILALFIEELLTRLSPAAFVRRPG